MRGIIWERIKQSREGEPILYLADFPYAYQIRHYGRWGSNYKVFFFDHYRFIQVVNETCRTVPEAKARCQEFHENIIRNA